MRFTNLQSNLRRTMRVSTKKTAPACLQWITPLGVSIQYSVPALDLFEAVRRIAEFVLIRR